jgi:glucose-6-phosphate 1-dehydrogenase
MSTFTESEKDIAATMSQFKAMQGHPADNCVMVIFGAAGDLTARKLIPALYNLGKTDHLPKNFAMIGFALEPLSEEDFRMKVQKDIEQFAPEPIDATLCSWLSERVHYISGDFRDPAKYAELKDKLAALDKQYGTPGNYF